MFFLDHIYLIPLLPACGAAIMLFAGRKLTKTSVNAVCVGSVVLAFVMGCGCFFQLGDYTRAHPEKSGYEKIVYTWLGTDTGHLNYTLQDGKSTAPFRADA